MARIKKLRPGETPEAARCLRVAIYTRVSSEMQLDGFSLESQLKVCREHLAKKGMQEVAIYTDEAESGRKADRPQFQALVRDGMLRQFDTVMVSRLERFARCRRDTENYLHDLNGAGLEIISALEPQFDFSSAAGKAYLGMISTFNQYYSDVLAENVAVNKATRTKSHGLWNGQVPFGYRVKYLKDGGDGVPYPDPHEAQGVQLAFEQYATGMYSDTDIAQLLNEAGYRPRGRGARALPLFSKDTIRETLQSRFYLGEARYRDQWFPARQDPIISEELFAALRGGAPAPRAAQGRHHRPSGQPRLPADRHRLLRPLRRPAARGLRQRQKLLPRHRPRAGPGVRSAHGARRPGRGGVGRLSEPSNLAGRLARPDPRAGEGACEGG